MNIHKTAILDKSVSLGKNVEIGAFSQILGNVKIGDDVKIKSNCVIGARQTSLGSIDWVTKMEVLSFKMVVL